MARAWRAKLTLWAYPELQRGIGWKTRLYGVLVGAAIYGLCARALRMLSHDDVVLLARVLPKPIECLVLLIEKLLRPAIQQNSSS